MEDDGETDVAVIVVNPEKFEAPLFREPRKKFSIKPFLIREGVHIQAVGFLETYAAGHNFKKIHTKTSKAKSAPGKNSAIMAKY